MMWLNVHRRFGVIDGKFCFEGGSLCGRGEGLYVFLTDQGEEITRSVQMASEGRLNSLRRPLMRNMSGTYAFPCHKLHRKMCSLCFPSLCVLFIKTSFWKYWRGRKCGKITSAVLLRSEDRGSRRSLMVNSWLPKICFFMNRQIRLRKKILRQWNWHRLSSHKTSGNFGLSLNRGYAWILLDG